jgi:hypothetical protein
MFSKLLDNNQKFKFCFSEIGNQTQKMTNTYHGPFTSFFRRIVNNEYFSGETKEYFGLVDLRTAVARNHKGTTTIYKTPTGKYFMEMLDPPCMGRPIIVPVDFEKLKNEDCSWLIFEEDSTQ